MPVLDGSQLQAIQSKDGTPEVPSGSTTDMGSIPVGHINPPCGGCGGPHPFDTVVPSVVWNSVIRAQGLSDYLCATCIIKAFVVKGDSFTAELWGDDLPPGVTIEIRVGGRIADDAAKISAENTKLRAQLQNLAMPEFCTDPRHGVPCQLPCPACEISCAPGHSQT